LSPVQEYIPSRIPSRGTQSRKCCPTQISLGSRSTLRVDAERAALVSGLQITTRKTSTRKQARAPMTGLHCRTTRYPGSAIVSMAYPSLVWMKSSLPDRTTRIWFHTQPIGWRTAVTGITQPLPSRCQHTSKGSIARSLRMTVSAEMNRSRYSPF
jgi:hypothetical protein